MRICSYKSSDKKFNFDRLNEDDEKINNMLRGAGKRPRN